MAAGQKSLLGRRSLIFLWVLSVALFFFFWAHPVGNKLLRLSTIASGFVFVGGALLLWWPRRGVRYALLTASALFTILLLLPSRQVSQDSLQRRYTRALGRYEGTLYVWGGENRLGIDCSGLVRQGMVDAAFQEGLMTLNGGLVRQSFALRWYDCSADALKNEYRGFAVRLGEAKALHEFDHSSLRAGDFAITSDGVHALAYLGDERWIEADPGAHKVILARKGDANPWLARPVVLMRWSVLAKNQ